VRPPTPIDRHDILATWREQLGAELDIAEPGVEAAAGDLVDAVLYRPADLDKSLARFGLRLGTDGWDLVTISRWVDLLFRLAGTTGFDRPSFGGGVALSKGWASGYLHCLRTESCTDPITGLPTTAVLTWRLRQVYDQCRAMGVAPALVYAMVVVDVDTSQLDSLTRDVALVVTSHEVQQVFASGETVCSAGGRILVLASQGESLTDGVGLLVAQLRCQSMLVGTNPLAWIEELPAAPTDIEGFLIDLVS